MSKICQKFAKNLQNNWGEYSRGKKFEYSHVNKIGGSSPQNLK